MKNYKIAIVLFSLAIVFSCDPRLDMDYDQWGDNAFITNVQIFAKEVKDDFQMAEFYENGDYTTGVRRIILGKTKVVIDNETFTVTITVPSGNDLSQSGFLITHNSTKVEPLEGSPAGGIVSNLTPPSTFRYRLHSADGTTHDWTIDIVE